jgi:MFS family permease
MHGAGPGVATVLFLASAVVFLESLFFTALAPALPYYKHTFGLSQLELGVVAGAYAAGAFIGAIPSGLFALRWGVRAAVLVGLGLLALGSLVLGSANNAPTLEVARFVQGVGCSVAWTGALAWLADVSPRARRGELLGVALGAAVAGSLFGPVVGAAAVRFGAGLVFSLIAGAGLLVIVLAWRIPPPSSASVELRSLTRAFRSGEALGGFYLVFLSALLLGTLFVVAPLQLDDFGWSSGQIAACFVAASLITMLTTPWIGRWSDRRSRSAPIVAGLLASCIVSLCLAIADRPASYGLLVVAAGIAYSIAWVPGTALISDGAERVVVDFALGFVLLNLAWAPGFVVGSAVGGSASSSAISSHIYVLLGAACAMTSFAVAVGSNRARRLRSSRD